VFAANLHVHLGICLEVEIPGRVRVAAAERDGDHHLIAVAQVQRRRDPLLARLAPGRRHQCGRKPQQFCAEPSVGSLIHPDVYEGEALHRQRKELRVANPPRHTA
jgi:hypothetical protein